MAEIYNAEDKADAHHQGPGSRAAEARWQMVNAPHLVALVRAGAVFVNGKLVERPAHQDQQEGGQQAA
jgi:hypothetical protein